MRLALALAAALLIVPACGAEAASAAPDQAAATAPTGAAKAAELDRLFAALKAASNADEARPIEDRIQALWLNSGDPEVNRLMDYAIAAVNAGAYQLAIGYLNSIILRKPDYAEGWNKRATVYWLMGESDHTLYAKSLADIDRTLALEPRHWGALAGRGWILEDLGKDRQALDAFHQSLAIDRFREDVSVSRFLLEDKLGKGILGRDAAA